MSSLFTFFHFLKKMLNNELCEAEDIVSMSLHAQMVESCLHGLSLNSEFLC